MKYFLKRTYSATYGTFGTCVNVGWLNTNDIVGFRIDRHSRTALDKETLDKIRARLSLLDTELVTADGFGKIKIVYEEIPADGLHEEYSDEIKAKAGEKEGEE